MAAPCEHHECVPGEPDLMSAAPARWRVVLAGQNLGAYCEGHLADAIEDIDIDVVLEPIPMTHSPIAAHLDATRGMGRRALLAAHPNTETPHALRKHLADQHGDPTRGLHLQALQDRHDRDHEGNSTPEAGMTTATLLAACAGGALIWVVLIELVLFAAPDRPRPTPPPTTTTPAGPGPLTVPFRVLPAPTTTTR